MTYPGTQPSCPTCGSSWPTERELDDHIVAAEHWSDEEVRLMGRGDILAIIDESRANPIDAGRPVRHRSK